MSLTLNEYQKLAMRTANPECRNLSNVGLGIGGECGEVADLIKKHLYHGHELDRDELIKELGDVCWYVALGCTVMDYNMGSLDISIYRTEQFTKYKLDRIGIRFVDLAGATAFHIGNNISTNKYIVRSLADILCIVIACCMRVDISIDEVLERNIEKLKKRYPDGFDSNKSINREE